MAGHLTRALGAYLRRERQDEKVTLAQFARLLQLDPRTYRRLEAGTSAVRLSTLQRLAAGLGVPVSELVRRAEEGYTRRRD